jgi:large subunit ribosomal protein L25
MANVNLTAATRREQGKGAARALRRAGKVPGVIYGHNREPASLVIEAPALARALTGASSSTVFELAVDGQAPVRALVREIQRNPLRQGDVLHIDFYEMAADEKVTVDLPVHLVGTPDGVRNFGGVLDHVRHSVTVKVLPADLVDHVELDVTNLGIGQSLFVRDLQLPKAEILDDLDQPVCSIVAPRVEAEAAAAVAEPSQGEPELIRKPKAEEVE